MANVVVTGSTRGIGLGLAKEFRKRGHSVVVSSRGQAAVEAAVAEVLASPGSGEVVGIACDVVHEQQVQVLWDQASAKLGQIDIWINNAGLAGPRKNVAALSPDEMKPVIDANIWGMIWGTRVPLVGMTGQGSGKIFNFEGFGSDGMSAPGLTIYGTTKHALRYFTKSVNKEIAGSPVILGSISPGIVVTDLLIEAKDLEPARWEKTKRMYNILADTVETVAPYLVEQALAANKPFPKIRWMTNGKAAWRFASSWATKRKVMPD